MYRYLFLCRIYPKSGLDVVRHNKAIGTVEKIIYKFSEMDPEIGSKMSESIDLYKKENEGYVLEMVPIVSDEPIVDPEKEAMPEIRSKFNGAELIRFIEVPNKYVPVGSFQVETENKFVR
jgi:hypothetical protein